MTDRIEGYAAAIFELARAEGELQRVETEFYSIARSLETSAELRDSLTDPKLPADRKQSIVDNLVGGRASEVTVNVVSLVVAQGRAGDLPGVATALAERVAAEKGREVAEVRTAVELDQPTLERLTAALSKSIGRQVEIRVVVDPTVVGGVVARVGDTVIDGTVRRRLQSLRETLQAR